VDNDLHDIPDLMPDSDDTDCDDPGPGGGKPNTPAATDDKSINSTSTVILERYVVGMSCQACRLHRKSNQCVHGNMQITVLHHIGSTMEMIFPNHILDISSPYMLVSYLFSTAQVLSI
jgi:hypothetical protein